MRRALARTTQFKRDLKACQKRRKDIAKLWAVVERLLAGRALDARHRRHRLAGAWAGVLECHIEPDWLLVWTEDEQEVVLVRTGTHADLFG